MKAWHVFAAFAVALVGVVALGLLNRKPPPPASARAAPPTLCTASRVDAVQQIIDHTDGRDVFVRPGMWNALPFASRKDFAALAAHCVVGGGSISIRHPLTGRELATYSPAWGYDGKE